LRAVMAFAHASTRGDAHTFPGCPIGDAAHPRGTRQHHAPTCPYSWRPWRYREQFEWAWGKWGAVKVHKWEARGGDQ
jgi:hypothetical protein